PLVCHATDSSALERTPEIMPSDGDLLRVGRLRVKVLHTPGHTPGSLCFKIGSYLFAGDTVFPGGPGHTASPEDFTLIVDSISRKILTLPARTVVLPGHGNGTTVGQARKEYAVFASRAHPHGLCGDVLWLS
ncbi:MAG: MBL fold metallo-hydrolase, partial [Dehalococcoidales bacterium]|nr:MBL fold metallo-hydrolase [Dehalococcoidales bacterium]